MEVVEIADNEKGTSIKDVVKTALRSEGHGKITYEDYERAKNVCNRDKDEELVINFEDR